MTYRERIPLDGPWDFLYDAVGELAVGQVNSADSWREAVVPIPWQAQFDDLRLASGVGWYRRMITVTAPVDGAAILHFGAADYHATVWLNDELIGEHEGGYLPFEFDVTANLAVGENSLVVKVVDPDTDASRWPAYPFTEIPHGKQSWYGPIGGLWQSVWLEQRSAAYIDSLRLTPEVGTSMLAVKATVVGARADGAILRLTVRDPEGVEVAADDVVVPAAGVIATEALVIDPGEIRLWSPDSPALYSVTAQLIVDGIVVDQTHDTCGFRTVESRDGRIYLNGDPIYLRGALDQAYYPETLYTPPSLEYLEDQARKAKELGLNCLRIHIKVGDPRYYEVADRLGLLVWTEIPNWIHLSSQAAQRGEQTFEEMVARDWNHPSIIAWTLINEDWGTDLVHNPEHRRWLADFTARAKEIDPTRLIVDNSACHPNLHVAGDIEDYHHYRTIPDHADAWDEWVADFAGRAGWAWADDYADNRRPDLPLIVSEFGNWGLPDPELIKEHGKDPWWFEMGHDQDLGIVYPHGLRRRYDAFELDRVFGSFERFVTASQEHMARSLAYEITSMRLLPEIAGYVITEFTDLHWECNGLMDMQRNVKQGLDTYFVDLNQDNVVTIRPQFWSGRPGAMLPVDLRAIGVDGIDGRGVLYWQIGEVSGEIPAPGGIVEMPLPNATDGTSGLATIGARWLSDSGEQIAVGSVEVAYLEPPVSDKPVYVVDDAELATTLSVLGYQVVDSMDEAVLLVTRSVTPEVMAAVQGGANALLIAGVEMLGQSNAISLPLATIVPREGTQWQGDWATSFSWLRKEGPFEHLPGGPLMEMEYAKLMPDVVIANASRMSMQSATWAALALGWIHHVVSLLSTFPYGRGQATVTTFKLSNELLAEDVAAQGLFAGLVNLATGE